MRQPVNPLCWSFIYLGNDVSNFRIAAIVIYPERVRDSALYRVILLATVIVLIYVCILKINYLFFPYFFYAYWLIDTITYLWFTTQVFVVGLVGQCLFQQSLVTSIPSVEGTLVTVSGVNSKLFFDLNFCAQLPFRMMHHNTCFWLRL